MKTTPEVSAEIKAFREKWILLGFKGVLADLFDLLNNSKVSKAELTEALKGVKVSLTDAEKAQIATSAAALLPKIVFPAGFFTETVDVNKNRVISVSKEFIARLERVEKFERETKGAL